MKNRAHFAHCIYMCESSGEVIEHLAAIEDYLLAIATYRAACRRWPDARIQLRQGDRVIEDNREPPV
jgi:hypothetical protein